MIIQGGVSTSYIEKDAYLIIVFGENKDELTVQKYDKNTANQSNNLLNTKLKSTVANLALAGITSPIAQNYASKIVSSATLGRINSSLFDIMSDGKISNQEVAEDFIGSCTNSLDNMFADLGFPTPSALYSAIMPTGSGVISKDLAPKFLNLFGKQSQKENKKKQKEKEKLKNVTVIKLRLVPSDDESLPISIPTRKTENNFNIATSINNENPERNFEAVIVHSDNKKINMYEIKRQLKKIREEKRHIDVYVCDNDVSEIEIIKDCLLSNLDFSVRDKNAIDCSLSVTKVPEWSVIIDTTLDKSLSNSYGANTGSSKRKVSGNAIKNKATKVQSIKNFTVGNQSGYDINNRYIYQYKAAVLKGDNGLANDYINKLTSRLNLNKANSGHTFTPQEVKQILDNGGVLIKI